MPIADFDNDGVPEIAYQRKSLAQPGFDNSNILIRTLHGDSSIETRNEIAVTGDLGPLFAADLDHDGRVDLLSAAFLFFNTESGWLPQPFSTGQPDPVAYVFGQYRFNDDEYPDFRVLVGSSTQLAVGTAAGPTVFEPFSYPSLPGSVVASVVSTPQRVYVDLNEDGLDDMIVNSDLDDGTSVVFVAFCTGGSPVEFADPMLLWQGAESPSVYEYNLEPGVQHGRVFVQRGAVMDEYVLPIISGEQPTPITRDARFPIRREVQRIVDVDQDGSPDLISQLTEEAPEFNSYYIRSVGRISYGFLEEPGAFVAPIGGVKTVRSHSAMFDVNGDGYLDLLGSTGIVLNEFWPAAKPRFVGETETSFDIPIESSVLPFDFDDDGDLDLIAYNAILQPADPADAWSLLPNSTFQAINPFAMVHARHPAFQRPLIVHNPGHNVPGADLRFVSTDDPASPVEVVVESDASVFWGSIVAADLNGDGADEIIGFDDDEGWTLCVRIPTAETYQIGQSLVVASPGRGLAAGDFNGDGHTDIAAAGEFELGFFFNDGAGNLTPGVSVALPIETNWLQCADLNGDGRSDLVACRGILDGTADIVAWLQPDSSDPTLGQVVTISEGEGLRASEVYAADFNRNGTMDLLVVGHDTPSYVLTDPLDPARRAIWLVNDDDASPSGALAGMNGDGYPDVVTVRADISWPRRTTVRYSMGLAAGGCRPDLNGDAIVDQGDIQVFVQLFLVQDLGTDFNGDGIVDLGDIQEFISLFLAGC